MPVTLSWQQIALRLGCTLIAGIVVGLNRDEKGRPAGMRTNVLVCLAASLAMIQANLLMGSIGKASDSFVVLDLMRLPLGILSGMGFIGAGVIMRREETVLGVTTAASLWVVTVLGLCFGGGQIVLGASGLVLVSMTLWSLKWFEKRLSREKQGILSLTFDESVVSESDIQSRLQDSPLSIHSWGISSSPESETRSIKTELRWRSSLHQPFPPEIIEQLLRTPGIRYFDWKA